MNWAYFLRLFPLFLFSFLLLSLSSIFACDTLSVLLFFLYLVQSRTCKRFLSLLCVSLSTILGNIRLFACSRARAHIHAYNRPPAHEQMKKILFFFFAKRKGEKKERKKSRERENNSVADWSRVTVHIRSNYKCSLASSLVFSLFLWATASVFSLFLSFSYFFFFFFFSWV